jgi:hypothetical protein
MGSDQCAVVPRSTYSFLVGGSRRPRDDAASAGLADVYGGLALIPAALLMAAGHWAIFWLILPALLALVWQLWLVTRRAERQMTVELAGSGALALAAPAAYLAATGRLDSVALSAWLLCWFQSAAAIVYVYLRLEQRRMSAMPTRSLQWAMGRRAVLYHIFNFVASLALSATRVLPSLVPLAFAAMLAEALRGVFRGVGVGRKSSVSPGRRDGWLSFSSFSLSPL